MFRVTAATALVVTFLLVGCRSRMGQPVSSAYLGDGLAPPATTLRDRPEIHSVAFVDEANGYHETSSEELLQPPEVAGDLPLHAQFTLADLEAIALQHNPTLHAAAARIQAARGRQLQAGLYANPIVGYHATEIGNQQTAGQQGAFLSQRIITGGKLGLDQAIRGSEVEVAHIKLHAQEQRVVSDVRSRFYDALVAQRRVQLTRELAVLGRDLVAAAGNLLAGRLGTANDLLQAQIKADEAGILYDNAVNQSEEAWRRLAAIVGLPTMEMATLAGELEPVDPALAWDECLSRVLMCNPEMRAAQAQQERACLATARARREPIPDVDFMLSLRHHNVTQDDVVNIQAGIPLPIFNRNQGNIRSAEADWIAAANEVKRIELDIQDRLATTYRQYTNALQQAAAYSERIVPRAEKSLNLVRDGYAKGQVDYLTLINSQQTYLQVSLAHLDSLRALWSAVAAIESQLLIDSLATSQ